MAELRKRKPMGINGLWSLISPIAKDAHVMEFRKKRIAVDASGWFIVCCNCYYRIYRGCYSCVWDIAMGIQTTRYTLFIEKMIRLLLRYDIEPILVFDGKKYLAKRSVDLERSTHRHAKMEEGKALAAQGKKQEAIQVFSQAISITSEMVQETIKLCTRLHIPYIVSPYECDAELAFLSRSGIVDAVISEDSDTLCFRCPYVLYKMKDNGVCKKIAYKDLFSSTHFDRSIWTPDLFELFCILGGCDYLNHLPYVGLRTVKKLIEKDPTKSAVLASLSSQKCHQYTEEYAKQLDDAIVCFRHQVVFDPISNTQLYLTPFDSSCSLSEKEKESLCGRCEAVNTKEIARGYEEALAVKNSTFSSLDTKYIDEYFHSIKCSLVPSLCKIELAPVSQEIQMSFPVVERPKKVSSADLTEWESKRNHTDSPTNQSEYFDNLELDDALLHEIETLEKTS